MSDTKDIDLGFKKCFPVECDTTYGVDVGYNLLHRHSSIEICRIINGTGKHIIGVRQYDFIKGDIFIINSNEPHLLLDGQDAVVQVVLFEPEFLCLGSGYSFDYYRPFWAAGKYYDRKLDASHKGYEDITKLLAKIETEFMSEKDGYTVLIKLYFLELAILLQRQIDMGEYQEHSRRIKNYNYLKEVFDYIDEHYSNKLKLKELANVANMSVTSFSSLFKYMTGVSPMAYLIRTRVLNAAWLLRDTNMRVLDVAMECGFLSMAHFIDCFKKNTGQAPNMYRKNRK
jgi:AraC-like DNA-binding protein